jgi:type III secretion protein S
MDEIVYAANKAIVLVIALSAAPVLVATFVGVVVGLFQTVMQIQEQTLPFGLKLLAVFGTLLAISGWLAAKMQGYAVEMVSIALR